MKWLLLAVIEAASVTSVFAQGTVQFRNYSDGSDLRAPAYGVETVDPFLRKVGNEVWGYPPWIQVYTGAKLEGTRYFAALLAAPGADVEESRLVEGHPTNCFRTGSGAGFLNYNSSTPFCSFDNVAPDAPVATVMMIAWDNASGLYPTWRAAKPAWRAGEIAAGASLPFNVTDIGGNLNSPPLLLGLRSFNIYYLRPVDIGLRMFDGTTTNRIACEPPGPDGSLASPLRIAKNGTNYGIALTERNSTNATRISVQTSSGVKALRRLP